MAEFEQLIAADGFVEHAQFGSNRYGTSKATIQEQTAKGKVVVLDIEMEVGLSYSSRGGWEQPSFPSRTTLSTKARYKRTAKKGKERISVIILCVL